MLRRGFNFVDGADGFGHLDAGLFFLAYQRDPRTAFVPVQLALSRADAMMEYLRHTGSGIWACPPESRPGGCWGDTLFRPDRGRSCPSSDRRDGACANYRGASPSESRMPDSQADVGAAMIA